MKSTQQEKNKNSSHMLQMNC